MEDFVNRFEDVTIAGMQYYMFIARKSKYVPYTVNNRVYSNMLLNTNEKNPDGSPFRNNIFWNDDTDLNIRALKKGSNIIQFNIFNCEKVMSMKVKGGNTDAYNKIDRKYMSQMIVDEHPDVAKLVRKYGRWHHHVNYKAIGKHGLRLKEGVVIPSEPNNYGLELVTKENI